ncbi:MAG: hypothetical protein WC548_01360 [Candidatus Pacearchaeota archaeon]
MDGIFSDEEMRNLRGDKDKIDVDAFMSQEERISGLEQAVSQIKKDYKTHDLLFERMGENCQIVFDLQRYGAYFIGRTPFCERHTPGDVLYMGIQLPHQIDFGKLYLAICRNRKNSVFVGGNNFNNFKDKDEHYFSTLDILLPVEDRVDVSELDMKDNDNISLVLRKYFESAFLCINVKSPNSFPVGRKYFLDRERKKAIENPTIEHNVASCTSEPYQLFSEFTGDDLVLFYKAAVINTLKEFDEMMKGDYSYRVNNKDLFRLGSRDFSGSKRSITKFGGFVPKRIDLSGLV